MGRREPNGRHSPVISGPKKPGRSRRRPTQPRVVSLTLTVNRSQTVASSLIRETPEKPPGDAPKWTPHFGAGHEELRRWTLIPPVQDPTALQGFWGTHDQNWRVEHDFEELLSVRRIIRSG